MHKIYKFPIKSILDETELLLPLGSKVLSIQVQDKQIVLWALVDVTISEQKYRKVYRYGTGWDADGCLHLQYIGTVQEWIGSNNFVWHFFITP